MINRLIGILMPPKVGATDEQLHYWRLTMVAAVVILAATMNFHMLWSVGALPGFEGEGFVRQGEFKQLAADNRLARRNSLHTTIVETRREECRAEGKYHDMLLKQRTDLMVEWRQLTSTDFPLPTCEDVK